ncbi:MAG: hypothetical protein AAF731_07635 [Bacteroidota bacterium]
MRLSLLLVLCPLLSNAQILKGTWMGYDSYNSKLKMGITDEFMIMYSYGYTDDPNNSSWRAYDSIPIHSMDDGVIVIKNKRGGAGFAAGSFTFRENGEVLKFAQLFKKFDSPEAAVKAVEEYKYTDLIVKEYYRMGEMSRLENKKSLDELTKKDFLQVMNRLQAYDKEMEGFLASEDQRMRRMIYRFTEGIINRTFVELGYNPYKMTDQWFFEKFRDNPDVQQRMQAQVYLRLE